jgi:hypothetical protein
MNKRTLFLVTVKSSIHQDDYYLIAKDETEASNKILEMYKKWDYTSSYVSEIKRLAEEGQYGVPKVLLFEDSDLVKATELLHQVSYSLSSGNAIKPQDMLYSQITDYLAERGK